MNDVVRQCGCKICVLAGKVQAVQAKLSPEDSAVIEQLLNEWEHEGTEAGHYKAVLQGKWPDTKPIPVPQMATCLHLWPGPGVMPKKWDCKCGTRVYRSYEDYCWD